VRQLEQQHGKDIWLLGGAELTGFPYTGTDTHILKVGPLTIGDGIPLSSSARLPPTRAPGHS
jgi:hypothetical protein